MQVKVMNKVYQMSRKEYEGLLKVASGQVSFGIYAVEKRNYAELRCDKCASSTKLKAMVRQFKSAGYKVHCNGR